MMREPTSHERKSGRPWNDSYSDGPAPWDIGGPQPAIVRLLSETALSGPVLDAGCGTGDNALHVASFGLQVLGFDVAEKAIAIAKQKAANNPNVQFVIEDAFQLDRLGQVFKTALDCGLFHTFEQDERMRYARSLATVVEPEGMLYVLCFSDQGPDTGPHPISRADLHAAFSTEAGWSVSAIKSERVGTRFHDHGAAAWLATIRRTRP